MSQCVWSSSLQSPRASAENPLSIHRQTNHIHLNTTAEDKLLCFSVFCYSWKHSVHMTWLQLIIMFWYCSYQMTPHLFRLASYENGQDLGEEAGQKRVERRLILEETIQFHQQFFIFSQSVIDLAHIWCKQLTGYVGIPGKNKSLLIFLIEQL